MPKRTIHAIYASTSGNVEAVVEKVAEIFRSQGLSVELHRAERTDPKIVAQNDLFLFATSTWEHGEINPFFKPLLKALKDISCVGKAAGMIGLGDNRYELVLFNMGIEKVRDAWKEQGGEQLYHTLKLNGDPYEHLEHEVAQWAAEIAPYYTYDDRLEGLLEGQAYA